MKTKEITIKDNYKHWIRIVWKNSEESEIEYLDYFFNNSTERNSWIRTNFSKEDKVRVPDEIYDNIILSRETLCFDRNYICYDELEDLSFNFTALLNA